MPKAYIGMGGNLPSWAGPPEATLAAAAARLQSLGHVACRSSLYSTEPVGFAAQPRFVNAVVALETELPPRTLLQGLLLIEKEFGRDRSSGLQNGPRTLDLDILLYGDSKVSEASLEIPHPRMTERAFVMVPLAEIATCLGDVPFLNNVPQWLNTLKTSSGSDANAVVPIQSEVWRSGCGHCEPLPRNP